MTSERDTILIESVSTHRARLVSALVHGELEQRRPVTDNVRRMVAGLVLTAVACAICAGISFVMSVLADRESAASTTGQAVVLIAEEQR